ncbi:NADPH-dependent F420 reductase [Flavihumibacter sp. R14]|nr:NADPH-dependent F420 reductase [Flavihumibacter soli]
MQTKQTVSIIGSTGNMGSAIARSLAKGNYRLLLLSGPNNTADSLADEIKSLNPGAEVESIDCCYNASWEADIIILAIPFGEEFAMAEKIREVANQKIVISIANPLNGTYDGLSTSPDTSAAEQLQKLLPNSKVVKAFNTSFSTNFNQPVLAGKQTDAFIAGDDEEALNLVSDLVETTGFNPLIAGPLSMSRTLEGMQLLLVQLNIKNEYNWQAGWKILHN